MRRTVASAALLAFPSTVDVQLQEHEVVFWLEGVQSRVVADRQRPNLLANFVLGCTTVLEFLEIKSVLIASAFNQPFMGTQWTTCARILTIQSLQSFKLLVTLLQEL